MQGGALLIYFYIYIYIYITSFKLILYNTFIVKYVLQTYINKLHYVVIIKLYEINIDGRITWRYVDIYKHNKLLRTLHFGSVWTWCTNLSEALASYTSDDATCGCINLSQKAFITSRTLQVTIFASYGESCDIQHCQDQRIARYRNFPDIGTCTSVYLATSRTDLTI
jgi:hypothetical protein